MTVLPCVYICLLNDESTVIAFTAAEDQFDW